MFAFISEEICNNGQETRWHNVVEAHYWKGYVDKIFIETSTPEELGQKGLEALGKSQWIEIYGGNFGPSIYVCGIINV